MYIVAGRLAGWIGAHAGDPADGELLRGIEIVRGELAGVGEREAQLVRQRLQAIGAKRHLAEIAPRTRSGRVAHGEVRAVQRKRALRQQDLEGREASAKHAVACITAATPAHEAHAPVVLRTEGAEAVHQLAPLGDELRAQVKVGGTHGRVDERRAIAARRAAGVERAENVTELVLRVRDVAAGAQAGVAERRVVRKLYRAEIGTRSQRAHAQPVAEMKRRIEGGPAAQAITPGIAAAGV